MRDYWPVVRRFTQGVYVSVVGFLDEGLLVSISLDSLADSSVSVVGFLDEGLLARDNVGSYNAAAFQWLDF
ncbi:TPA: hypothetical protein I8010_002849 [Legionella pneumophila]|nr:hypothetical protein [Legionella pneumophila]HAT1995066.1 hypothetical protein [Legionella pneumophila]HAT2052647.1 hypothetical protein [Legionella pneumophila]HAT2061873.1 hypothetical protein [Legionella pneumophila]